MLEVSVYLKPMVNRFIIKSVDNRLQIRKPHEHTINDGLFCPHIIFLQPNPQPIFKGTCVISHGLSVKYEVIGRSCYLDNFSMIMIGRLEEVKVDTGVPGQQVCNFLNEVDWRDDCLVRLTIWEAVNDASVLPNEEVGVPLVILQGLAHQQRFHCDHCSIEIKTVLWKIDHLIPICTGFSVFFSDFFDQWVVPHVFKPFHLPLDKDIIRQLSVLLNEQFEFFAAVDDEVTLCSKQHLKVFKVLLE